MMTDIAFAESAEYGVAQGVSEDISVGMSCKSFMVVDFDAAEAAEYLESLGVSDSGVSLLIRATYDLLGLASYFTAGEQEVRAWTFRKGMKAPECAGVIHTDFEKGFIKADVVSYQDLIAAGSTAGARDAGKYRLEGKDYEFKDGDVALFRFNN